MFDDGHNDCELEGREKRHSSDCKEGRRDIVVTVRKGEETQ